jgi:aminopeptidase
VQATATKGEDFLNAMLDTDAGARYLGEFAIGTNDGIQQFTRNILFDEKMGGTVHMAVGASYPDTGGKNDSAVHWDMICDMRSGGEVIVDGVLFYKDGSFVV